MARAMFAADLRGVLPRIDVPTLLIYAEADIRLPRAVAEEIHDRIPTSTLLVLLQVGHQLNMEAAERFNDVLRDFLRQQQTA